MAIQEVFSMSMIIRNLVLTLTLLVFSSAISSPEIKKNLEDNSSSLIKRSTTDFLDHKNIELEDFNLYKVLIGIKAMLLAEKIDELQYQNNPRVDWRPEEKSPLAYTEQAIQDLKYIVTTINRGDLGGNLEIQYKLINTYNFLQDREITPRSLRIFKEEIIKFDNELQSVYKKKKHYLSQSVLDLFNKIMLFNHQLIHCIIKDNNFDFTMNQIFKDLFLHRPWEFIVEYKLLFGGLALIAGAIVAATYGYPLYIARVLANQNPQFPEMRQLHGFSQPTGSGDCGYYAAVHTMLMMNEGPYVDPDALQQRLNGISSITRVVDQLKALNRGADWIDGDQVLPLLHPRVVQHLAADFQNIGILPQNLHFEDIHMIENVGLLAQGQGIQGQLLEAINRFRRDNRPQGLVLLLAGNGANQHGHWISVRIQRNAQGILQPILLNSNLWNATNLRIVNQVIELFANQPIQSEYGLANIAPSLDAAGAVLDNDAHVGDEADRYAGAIRHLIAAIRAVDGAGDAQRAQEFAFYRGRITDLFNRIRNDALRLGIENLDIRVGVVNLNRIQTVDQFIQDAVGHPLA